MGPPDICGVNFIVFIIIALVYWVIWLALIQEEFFGVLFSIGLAWGTCYSISWIGVFISAIRAALPGIAFVALVLLGIAAACALGWLGFIFIRWIISIPPPQAPVQPPTTVVPPPPPPLPPFVSVSTYLNTYALGPNELYHGTSVEAARDIFTHHRWKSGMQGCIFMTNQFGYAADMAQRRDVAGSGEILVVHYHPLLQLDYGGGGVYTFDIMRYFGSWLEDEYYIIEGLTPIHILDIHGRIIA